MPVAQPAKMIKTRIQNKHETEANWQKATEFVPLEGELIIYDPDDTHVSPRMKIGDGKTNVNNLGFINPGIDYGTADPTADIASQFYFKYSTQ
jgi:hypothetical protein